jgi:hypothetical protein
LAKAAERTPKTKNRWLIFPNSVANMFPAFLHLYCHLPSTIIGYYVILWPKWIILSLSIPSSTLRKTQYICTELGSFSWLLLVSWNKNVMHIRWNTAFELNISKPDRCIYKQVLAWMPNVNGTSGME